MSTAKKKDLNSLGDIYGSMLNGLKKTLVKEGKEGKVKPGEIGEVPLKDGGPQEKSGFKKPTIDKKNLSKKKGKENLYNIDNLSCDNEEDEEIPVETQKIARESLNNFMSRKSIFDRLYENVINGDDSSAPMGGPLGSDMGGDEAALGIDTEMEDEGEGDEVTFTLDRATAQTLHDALAAILGGEEELGDELEDEGDDMDTEVEDEEDDYGMDEEDEEELGHPGVNAKEPNYGKNNKVGNLKTQSGGAQSKYTDKVGDDGDYGHALVNAKEPNYGKNNKVGNLKGGKSLFEQ